MKEFNLLIWITQLGLSVAIPPVLMILLAKWLQSQFGWGQWALWVGIGLGVIMAIDGLRTSFMIMAKLAKDKKDSAPTPISFNDHT